MDGLAWHRLSILAAMSDPTALRRIVKARQPRFFDELETMVNIDCGSYTPDGVNRIADLVVAALREEGATVERIAHAPAEGGQRLGDLVVGRFEGDGPGILLIGHMDTVFDPGNGRGAPLPRSRRACHGSRCDRHEGRAAGWAHAIAALHEAGAVPP